MIFIDTFVNAMAYKTSKRYSRVRMRDKMRYRRKTTRRTRATTIKRIARRVTQRMIGRLNERKFVAGTSSTTQFNSTISTVTDLLQIIPPVARGTSSSTRIGNKITPRKLTVRGIVQCINTVDQVIPPVEAWVFLLRHKNKKKYANLDATDCNFLQDVTSNVNFDGTFYRAALPVDRVNFEVVAKRKFNLQALSPTGLLAPNLMTAASSVTVLDNMGKSAQRFTISFKPKGPFFYAEDNQDGIGGPDNQCYFLALGYNYLPGRSPDVVDTKVQMQYNTLFYYTDM